MSCASRLWISKLSTGLSGSSNGRKQTVRLTAWREPEPITSRNRALLAVGHTLLTIISHGIKRGTMYRESGANYLDRLDERRARRRLVHCLEQLGHMVILSPLNPELGLYRHPASQAEVSGDGQRRRIVPRVVSYTPFSGQEGDCRSILGFQ